MFNIQNFISFKGRIPRMTFWLSILILMIIQWVLFALFGGMAMFSMDPTDPAAAEKMAAAMTPLWIISVFLWPSSSSCGRRWPSIPSAGTTGTSRAGGR
jgi:uncharacterized membrane protein YhaH (DUF805 family)